MNEKLEARFADPPRLTVSAACPLYHGAPFFFLRTSDTMLARGSTAAAAVQSLVFLLVWLNVAPIDSFVTQQAGVF